MGPSPIRSPPRRLPCPILKPETAPSSSSSPSSQQAGSYGSARKALTGESDAAGSVVVCQTREGFYRVDPLDGDAAYTVTTAEGENRVSIAHGTVDVTWADCSNQVCVDHDPISAVGDQIVCLPHGMVLEIVADEADAAQLV